MVSDIVCTRRGDYSTTKVASTSDHSTGLTMAILFKYGLMLLAALALPFVFFKLFVLPMAVLFALKKISLLNSVLLGSLLFKHKFWKHHHYNHHHTNGPNLVTSTTARPAPIRNTLTLRYEGVYSGIVVFFTSLILFFSDDNEDYIDITEPDEDLTRVLKFAKKRNKKW